MTDTWLPLKPIRRPCGHLVVNLHRDGEKTARYIHHLVMEAFVGPRPEGLVCCHWDGDPTNNRVENLRWDTHRANGADTIRHGRRKFGEEAGSKLAAAEVLEIRRKYADGARKSQLAAEYGVTGPQIANIVNWRAWRHLPELQEPTSSEL